MNIALVDDEQICRNELKSVLTKVLSSIGVTVNKIDTFSSSENFLKDFSAGKYDIIFLDIYMDAENGIDLARKIRESDGDAVLAFCTSSNEFASETYEVKAGYYLNKPVSEEKVQTMFKRINLRSIEHNRTVSLPDGFRCYLRQIIFTEYINHTVVFHLKDEKPHGVYMNHYDVEALLLQYKSFCQVNKGSIVNLAAVKRIDGGVFTMLSGENIPISRRRLKEVSDKYTKYRFEKMSEEVDI